MFSSNADRDDDNDSEKVFTSGSGESTGNESEVDKQGAAAKRKRPPSKTSQDDRKCFFCTYTTTEVELFNKHLIDEHCDLIFCCNMCNSYLPRLELMPHMTEHAKKVMEAKKAKTDAPSSVQTPAKQYRCEVCDKCYQSASGIKYHMNAHHVHLQTYSCPTCAAKFSSKRVLENHQRSIHARGQRNYSCTTCGKVFKTDSSLYIHRKQHSLEKKFKCDNCGRAFRFKHHLVTHMLQHKEFSGRKALPYECNRCRKKFAAVDNLRKHKKVHDQAIRDFSCHICGAKMKQKRYLSQHMRKVHLQRLPLP